MLAIYRVPQIYASAIDLDLLIGTLDLCIPRHELQKTTQSILFYHSHPRASLMYLHKHTRIITVTRRG